MRQLIRCEVQAFQDFFFHVDHVNRLVDVYLPRSCLDLEQAHLTITFKIKVIIIINILLHDPAIHLMMTFKREFEGRGRFFRQWCPCRKYSVK